MGLNIYLFLFYNVKLTQKVNEGNVKSGETEKDGVGQYIMLCRNLVILKYLPHQLFAKRKK